MIDKILKSVKVVKQVKDARKVFTTAKANGEVSIVKELTLGNVAPGAAWLMFRGATTGVVSAVIGGVIGVADPFVAADLSSAFTPGVIEHASQVVVGAGFLWCVLDIMRSFARGGLFPGTQSDSQ